ncbi:Hypothetical protein PHPALM_6241 [Phytophthora palmivora]|uniref:WLGC domain-containing protein n=1 Tax=Phytophthora palmivora TaxID=4796 RepID=A0A2P4YFN9_9STRA|nr:Hypothetical protein PHPALM_6241 [Phytophthora palmivora]
MVAKVIDVPIQKDSPRLSNILQALSSTRKIATVGPLVTSSRNTQDTSSGSLANILNLRSQEADKHKISFHEAFGLFGIPIVAMVLGCIAWTLWLIILIITPNDATNVLMDTSMLDSGKFWLIPDEWSTLQACSVAGLSIVVVFYMYILLKILVWRSQKNMIERKLDNFLERWRAAARSRANGELSTTFSQKFFTKSWKLYVQWNALTNIHGQNRKFWNFFLKIQDIVMLALLLHDILETGSPVQIVYGLAAMASLNSFSFAVAIIFSSCTALVEVLVDSLFDFGSTVLYPLTVLYFCKENFHYDRAVYFISLEVLPIGSFERRARMYANPAEIALVRSFLDSLRILDEVDFFLRIGMNLAFSYRLKRIVEVLIEMGCENHQHQQPRRKRSLLHPPVRSGSVEKMIAVQRSVPKAFAIIFVAYSVGILVITHESIVTSQTICSPHPECVVFAYRWHNSDICPCRAIVDGDSAPMMYHEWINPVDATKFVSLLAAAGALETLQLVNRQLTILPDELRGCHNLQLMQIEGKTGSTNLGNLSEDLFADMPELRYLQMGIHPRMLHFPPLDGTPKLRTLLFSRMYNLVRLSSFTHLTALERLELGACKNLDSLPDLKPIQSSLRTFIVLQGAHLCCNGFLGACDLTNPFCKNSTCLDDPTEKATNSTLQTFDKFPNTVCQPYSGLSQVPTAKTIQMCDGVPFRQCQLPGFEPNTSVVGICYNHRMQVLACNPDPDKIRARRRQIQDGVGAECNPDEEAWLGCSGQSIT